MWELLITNLSNGTPVWMSVGRGKACIPKFILFCMGIGLRFFILFYTETKATYQLTIIARSILANDVDNF